MPLVKIPAWVQQMAHKQPRAYVPAHPTAHPAMPHVAPLKLPPRPVAHAISPAQAAALHASPGATVPSVRQGAPHPMQRGDLSRAMPQPGALVEAFPAPTRVLLTPNPAALAPTTTEAVNAHVIEWPDDGWVFAMSATTQGDGSGTGAASIGVRIVVGDNNEEVVTDGQQAAHAVLSAIGGNQELEPIPLLRRVQAHQKWFVSYRNFHGATTFTPTSCFWFLKERDRVAQGLPPLGHPEWASLMPFPAPTRYIKVPNLAQIAASTLATGQMAEFQQQGEVVFMCGSAVADATAAGMASLAISVRLADTNEELFQDGNGAQQVPFALVFGSLSTNLYPVRRRVYAHEKWVVTLRNLSTGTPFTPEVLFGVRDDRLIEAYAKD